MSTHLRRENCCTATVEGKRCLRPVRELGRLCSQCWRGLAPLERDLLRWEERIEGAAEDTERIDILEVWWSLPPVEPPLAA